MKIEDYSQDWGFSSTISCAVVVSNVIKGILVFC